MSRGRSLVGKEGQAAGLDLSSLGRCNVRYTSRTYICLSICPKKNPILPHNAYV